jgi:hypothetical protein
MFMKVNNLIFAVLLFFCTLKLFAAQPFSFENEDVVRFKVNNRILAKVNGKAVSVIDVMKKMDMLFFREFPEYATSSTARFQFYDVNWKHVLQDLINKELVLADAEENKLEVSCGDVRQEMEDLFGPNIIANLDQMGMTFEEASKIVLGDIKIRRMLGIRVHAKSIRMVTPAHVRAAYESFAKDSSNIRLAGWEYQVISIRDKEDPTKGEALAMEAHRLLREGNVTIDTLKEKLDLAYTTSVNISEIYKHNEQEVPQANKDILSQLDINSFSNPISQQSRSDKSIVFRIFYLKGKVKGGIPPFAEVAGNLRESLVDKVISRETDAYLKRLRNQFGVRDDDLTLTIPEDFKPFVLLDADL